MKVQKETETEMLARLMAEGFRSMDRRFDALEGTVGSLDDRVGTLENSVGSLAQEVRILHHRIDHVVIPALDDHARRIKDIEMAQ